MTECCQMYVLSVDTGIKIENITKGEVAAYNGTQITVVHLFHDAV